MNAYSVSILTRAALNPNGLVAMAFDFNMAPLIEAGFMVQIPGLNRVYSITPAGRDYYNENIKGL